MAKTTVYTAYVPRAYGGMAGAVLGLNYTTVARRIARIEGVLGVMLFERLADGYRVTETGQLVAQYANKMEAAEHGLMRQLPKIGDNLVGAIH